MSSNGGYGFVLNSQEIIIFVGRGTDAIDNFGSSFVYFLRESNLEDIKAQVSCLEATAENEEPLIRQYDPQKMLEEGRYSDGSWVINTGIDHLYIANFDSNRLEIYRSGAHKGKIPGRFGNGQILTGKERNKEIPVLMGMYPLDALPENLRWLEENQYDLLTVPLVGEPGKYDTTGDPTFLYPNEYSGIVFEI